MSIENSPLYHQETPSKLGIAISTELCYNGRCLDERDRGVLLLNAINSTQYIIVGKAPLIRWINVPAVRLSSDGRPNRGRFVMSEITQKDMDRFWRKVNKDGPIMPHMDSQCWVWTAPTNSGGYGKIRISSISTLAHRFSYELHYGSIPAGLFICHHCDNPACIKPDHLYAGTAIDNAHDVDKRGLRHARMGESHPFSKLTEEDVLYIREQWTNRRTTGKNQNRLAKEKNVSRQAISLIIHRTNWKHI